MRGHAQSAWQTSAITSAVAVQGVRHKATNWASSEFFIGCAYLSFCSRCVPVSLCQASLNVNCKSDERPKFQGCDTRTGVSACNCNVVTLFVRRAQHTVLRSFVRLLLQHVIM